MVHRAEYVLNFKKPGTVKADLWRIAARVMPGQMTETKQGAECHSQGGVQCEMEGRPFLFIGFILVISLT